MGPPAIYQFSNDQRIQIYSLIDEFNYLFTKHEEECPELIKNRKQAFINRLKVMIGFMLRDQERKFVRASKKVLCEACKKQILGDSKNEDEEVIHN